MPAKKKNVRFDAVVKDSTESHRETEYIEVKVGGTAYTLEFNRDSVEFVENSLGINVLDIFVNRKIPSLSNFEGLFCAAMRMHHMQSVIDGTWRDVYVKVPNDGKLEIFGALLSMLSNAIGDTILEFDESGEQASWTIR